MGPGWVVRKAARHTKWSGENGTLNRRRRTLVARTGWMLPLVACGVIQAGCQPPQGEAGVSTAALELPEDAFEGAIVDGEGHLGWSDIDVSVSDQGESTFELPIWVPPGRRGIQPELGQQLIAEAPGAEGEGDLEHAGQRVVDLAEIGVGEPLLDQELPEGLARAGQRHIHIERAEQVNHDVADSSIFFFQQFLTHESRPYF